jgi:hypothetical protein
LLAICALVGVQGVAAQARPLPAAPNCRIFPADNPWNQRVDRLPVAAGSSRIIATIGLGAPVRPDFAASLHPRDAPIGIPYAVVSDSTHWAQVFFKWPLQSDNALYPLHLGTPIQGGPMASGDRHVIVVDRDTCTDYELWDAIPFDGGSTWFAGAGAIFDLRSDQLRPDGWTSADAAGLPILAGLVRYSEVAAGSIDHAIRFTAPCTAPSYVYPARHWSTDCPRRYAPPMGLRVRLKASVKIAGLPYQARVIAQALKRYGMILADNGEPWHISGAPNQQWDDYAISLIRRLHGRDFEVVDTSSLPHPGA